MVTAYGMLPPGCTKLPAGVMELWGKGIFENGSNMDVVARFDKESGLKRMEQTFNAAASDLTKHVTYSVYAKQCSGPNAVEIVRKHLDSGVLAKLAAKQVKAFFNPLKASDFTCHGQTCCILAACALSLGCTTFNELKGYKMFFDTYAKFIRAILGGAAISNISAFQLKQALESFTSGIPYDFGSQSEAEVRQAKMNAGLSANQATPSWVMHVGGFSANEEAAPPRPKIGLPSVIGPCTKEDMHYENKPGECGQCCKPGAKLVCGRCRDMIYCNKACQKEDWNRHKVVCRTPEDAQDMRENGAKWSNAFDISAGGMSSLFDQGGKFGKE
ncbi:hypothetical protein AC578_7175 [Pseudocercospora eumusae]|uniref:MYND-type domain-containing protein n=1 Tax=Pseudocercospora eumusae TaxID=321146 RepID=A0A139HX49_9PEZI|nr:hypothetical protein AC578_7175 [Pseudocercospora eumusae]